MKNLPEGIVERGELNFRQGIKSSLSEIRSIVALLYVFYVSNDKKASVQYTEEYAAGGNTKIKIDQGLFAKITAYNPAITEDIINKVPLFTSQMEALQVGVELFLRLGKVEFANHKADSSERTGGNRYNKIVRFGPNITLIDIFLSSYSNDRSSDLINSWLNNKDSNSPNIDAGLKQMLTIFSEETKFKIRTNGGEVEFQQEGIYKELVKGNSVESADIHELVGPFRVFKSYVKEGVHPFINDNNGFVLKPGITDFPEYANLVSNGLDIIPKRTTVVQIEKEGAPNVEIDVAAIEGCHNRIFYGAPGTGKSHKVRKLTEGQEKTVITFHPDTDYSSFVGSYKPQLADNGKDITYGFVPQAFAKAYVSAWKDTTKPHYLVIEEINRGNCAQIFGDIFQLLDRRVDGYSDYVIDVDKDFADYIKQNENLGDNEAYKDKIIELAEIAEGGEFSYSKIALPGNLYIYATMNTSDQSLFPMDSAFKRRWEWEYLPIDYTKA